MKKIIIFITVVFLISSCSLTPKNEGKVVDVNQKLNDQTNTVDSGAVKSSNIFTGEEKSNFEVNILADKQVYTNKDFHFQAEYPLGWENPPYYQYGGDSFEVSFGTFASKAGGYIWGISYFSSGSLEEKIAFDGSQFSDRIESRSVININSSLTGLLVEVSTPSNLNWKSKSIFLEKGGNLYKISNGAVEDSAFVNFYKSFRFTE